MDIPSKEQSRLFAIEIVGAALTELALTRLARRLREGRSKPGRRWLRRGAGVVISELLAAGAADLYWQRRRLRVAFDRQMASAAEANHPRHALVPQQRVAANGSERSHAAGMHASPPHHVGA